MKKLWAMYVETGDGCQRNLFTNFFYKLYEQRFVWGYKSWMTCAFIHRISSHKQMTYFTMKRICENSTVVELKFIPHLDLWSFTLLEKESAMI